MSRDFARQLERELAEAIEQRDEAINDGCDLLDKLNKEADKKDFYLNERDIWKSRASAYEQDYNEMLKRVDEVAKERDYIAGCLSQANKDLSILKPECDDLRKERAQLKAKIAATESLSWYTRYHQEAKQTAHVIGKCIELEKERDEWRELCEEAVGHLWASDDTDMDSWEETRSRLEEKFNQLKNK